MPPSIEELLADARVPTSSAGFDVAAGLRRLAADATGAGTGRELAQVEQAQQKLAVVARRLRCAAPDRLDRRPPPRRAWPGPARRLLRHRHRRRQPGRRLAPAPHLTPLPRRVPALWPMSGGQARVRWEYTGPVAHQKRIGATGPSGGTVPDDRSAEEEPRGKHQGTIQGRASGAPGQAPTLHERGPPAGGASLSDGGATGLRRDGPHDDSTAARASPRRGAFRARARSIRPVRCVPCTAWALAPMPLFGSVTGHTGSTRRPPTASTPPPPVPPPKR